MKKFASLLLALVMILGLAVPAFAAGTSSITIKAGNGITSLLGREFEAYKILEAQAIVVSDATDPAKTETKYIYTVAPAWKPFFTDVAYFSNNGAEMFTGNEVDFDEQVRNYIQSLAGGVTNKPENTDDLFAFAAKAYKYAQAKNLIPEGNVVADSHTEAMMNNLEMGYYVIVDVTPETSLESKGEAVSALMLGTTDVEVVIKSEVTTVIKDIENGTDANGEKIDPKFTNGNIDNCVNFTLTSKVPDMLGYTKYTFTFEDTMSRGLTFVDETNTNALANCQKTDAQVSNHNHNVTVIADGHTLTKVDASYVPTTDPNEAGYDDRYNVYTLTIDNNSDGTTSLNFDLPYIYEAGWTKGEPITVNYYAIINEHVDITSTGNPNEVKIRYSNDPTDEQGPTGTTPKDTVKVFASDLTLKKVDEIGTRLIGAKFTLEGKSMLRSVVTTETYVANVNGDWYQLKPAAAGEDYTYTKTAPTTETGASYVRLDDDSDYKKFVLEDVTTVVGKDVTTQKITAIVGADGELNFAGLGEGIYTITEIEAPDGYNLLKYPLYVKLIPTFTKDNKGYVTDVSWSLMGAQYTEDGKPKDASGNGVTVAGANDDTSLAKVDFSVTYNERIVDVVNKAGTELPSTGGMGTTMFYVVGIGMMLAAIVLLASKKRMSA